MILIVIEKAVAGKWNLKNEKINENE